MVKNLTSWQGRLRQTATTADKERLTGKNMRHLIDITAAILTVLALTACTDILRADFEADPLGAPPLSAPAGPPDDALIAQPLGNATALITNQNPIEKSQSLRISGTDPRDVDETVWLFFRSAPVPANAERIFVTWQGRLDNGGRIWAGVGEDRIRGTVALRLQNGEATGQSGQNLTDIGSYNEGNTHTALLVLNNATGMGVVQLSENGIPNQPASFPAQFETGAPLYLSVLLDADPSGSDYVIDDVAIGFSSSP